MTIEISGRPVDVHANGLRHHLLAYGSNNRGDVVILPGITSPAATAEFIAVPISEQGFRVHVPDLRGRGATDVPPPGSYHLTDYAADVAGLVDALELREPVIVGHSLGARIAAAYAVLHGADPLGHLVLVDPPTSGPGRGPYPTTWEAFQTQLREAKRGTTAEEVRRFYPHWPERELQLRAEVLASCDETAIRETYAGFEAEDFFPYWEQIKPPASLIRGSDSPMVPPKAAAELATANPGVPIYSVPGAGHMVPWDNFTGFLDVLLPLLPATQEN